MRSQSQTQTLSQPMQLLAQGEPGVLTTEGGGQDASETTQNNEGSAKSMNIKAALIERLAQSKAETSMPRSFYLQQLQDRK